METGRHTWARRGDFDSAVRSLLVLADCSGETLSATDRAASQRLHLLIALLGDPHMQMREFTGLNTFLFSLALEGILKVQCHAK
jgi:hypothetical protein